MYVTHKKSGFTIVELLIVIVVIAILAAISIVAYTGVQNRAKASKALMNANTVIKKAEAYNSLTGGYPRTLAQFDSQSESLITGGGIGLATPTSNNGADYIYFQPCAPAAGNGARVGYWKYDASAPAVNYLYLGVGADCGTTGGFASAVPYTLP